MKPQLYKWLKGVDSKSLTEEDKEELLLLFMVTKNDLIRNQIAFIFSDVAFEKAIPYILKKINDKRIAHNNGSLVYSLESFDLKKYFIPIIKIISEHEYEPRLWAYGIAEQLLPKMSVKMKEKALIILESRRRTLERFSSEKGINSSLHFVEKTIEMINENTSTV